MKSVMFAAAALVAMTGFAMAEAPSFIGYSEYAVEADTLELGVGAELAIADGFTLTPMIVGTGAIDAFDFDHAEIKATYSLDENVSVYGKLKSDADFKYSDVVLGAAFQF